ncbi:VOC family protein [Cellulomonas sp. KRMCY2]|uniref:VOC family protein n=1 Tax=Cellulomonas sp. KRMCY2 TaxID=1304865 RepID=UPI00045E87AA|nr:VOC family protein [Cellulomonas sp. KRMCY2]
MTVHTGPRPTGTPTWVDLMVPDLGAATTFYGAVLGWEFPPAGARALPGGLTYLSATRDGHVVAGIGAVAAGIGADDTPQEGPAPAWATYLATDDVEATTAAAVAAGATVLVPPDSVGSTGSFAWLLDPTGAVFCLWQAGEHTGAGLTDEPGSMAWNELLTNDVEAAKGFYATVFGWTYDDISEPDFSYATFAVGGQLAGGLGALDSMRAAGDQPRWLVYFKVADADDAAASAAANGGTVVADPWDSEYGRLAVLGGPAGETFAIIADAALDDATLEDGVVGTT